MSQSDFGTIDPNAVGGTALAGLLGNFRDALNSGHSGASRPTYVQAGMVWVDTSAAPIWRVKRYDGTDDIVELELDITNNTTIVPQSVWQAELDVASGATCDIGGADSARVRITGSVTITSFGTKTNRLRFVRFAAALTLTHNATTLSLKGSVNRSVEAGDTGIYQSDASGNWREVMFEQAAGPAVSRPFPAIRQTVLSGPTGTHGDAQFGGSTGSTTVTASATLRLTAANGFDGAGPVDRMGTIINPQWTGLSTNGKMYLYLDVAADGSCTPGAGTLAPIYRWGGADVTTSGQFVFDVDEMIAKVGNGSAAVQTWRVYVGEVTVAGGVVTAITWYSLRGKATSTTLSVPAVGGIQSFDHNIGVPVSYLNARCDLYCQTAQGNFLAGDIVQQYSELASGGQALGANSVLLRGNQAFHARGSLDTRIVNTDGTTLIMTAANWAYVFSVERRF